MKIGIDVKSAFESKRSGIGNYVYQLVKNLLNIDAHNNYFLYSSGKNLNLFQNKNVTYLNRKNPFSLLMYPDVFHGPDFKLLPVDAKKKIVTFHDLACLKKENFMSEDFKKLTNGKIKNSVKKADIIIAVSYSIKKELLEYFKLDSNKIKVIYHGINEELPSKVEEDKKDKVLKKHNIKLPFFLFVGNLEIRKNISLLLKAFELFKKNDLKSYRLVLVGKGGHGYEKIKEDLNNNSERNNIIELGWIEDRVLSSIYSSAEAFIFPSLYEGFGLPVLEAMRFGLPVIASDIPALKEITGGAAALVNPSQPEDMAEAMYKISSNYNQKKEFIEKGNERIKFFSWEKTAKQMLEIYES